MPSRYQFNFKMLPNCPRLIALLATAAFLIAGTIGNTAAQSSAKATGSPAAAEPTTTSNPALTMWYDKPAKVWMTEALPIGNGPMGAMLFGDTNIERIQFNEISLWSGDRVSERLLGITLKDCLLYTSPSPRDKRQSRMPSSA